MHNKTFPRIPVMLIKHGAIQQARGIHNPPCHFKNVSKRVFLCCVALVVFFPVLLIAEDATFILQDGVANYEGTSDTMLIAGEANSEKNYGALPAFLIGAGTSVERRVLIRFDLSRLKGAKVTDDALLELTQSNVRGFPEGTFEIGLFLIDPENAGWVEGTGELGEGCDAGADEPAWDFSVCGPPRKSWAGGFSHSEAEQQISTFVYDCARDREKIEVRIPAEVIQSWIDSPKKNGGVLLKKTSGSAEAFGGFFSSEHRQLDLRPKLIVKAKQ